MALEKQTVLSHMETGRDLHVEADELAQFEDILVDAYIPPYPSLSHRSVEMARADWAVRERLVDALRGKHFLGSLLNIEIAMMDNPYTKLLDSGKYVSRNRDPVEGAASTLGFIVTADLSSSRKSDVGQLIRPVWIVRRAETSSRSSASNFWRRLVGQDSGDNHIEAVHSLATRRFNRH